MTKEDVAHRVRFEDSVARGRDYYYPYRTLLPRSVENLLVAGRHYSATSAAQKMSREIPPCMAMGEATGVAAALAVERRRVGAQRRHRQAAAHAARPGRRPRRPEGPERRHPGHCPFIRGGRMTTTTQHLPLHGIRVIDFTQVMMGPVCTQMLADHGADVIKIERKGAGDLSRSTFAPVAGHDNPIFCSLNRNKRSVEIDLRDPAQVDLVKALIADADVVTNNFRAGVMERLGLGYEDCRTNQPAHRVRRGHRLRRDRPLCAQGRPGCARAGPDGRDGAPRRRLGAGLDLPDRAGRLHGRHAHGAGHPVRAAAARTHRRRPEDRGLALRLDAGHADAGSRDDHDGGLGGQLGRHAAVGRLRYAERPAGAGRRIQDPSAARHLHGAGDRRPLAGRALRRPGRRSSSTRPNCTRSSGSALRATRASTGWPGSRSRTCSRRRCATCARPWSTRRPCTTR